MTKTWFISDTHFGHVNILKYDERPFNDIEDMKEEIIKRWNKKVKNGDTVWFLGDFAMFNKKEYIQPIVKRLNGIKNIVMGNHDTKSPQFYRDCGFNEAYDHPVILKDFFILSHEPMFITENMPYFNIYGHVHNHSAFQDKTENSCCVSCCRWNYEPIRIEEFDNYSYEKINTHDLVIELNDGNWNVDVGDYNTLDALSGDVLDVLGAKLSSPENGIAIIYCDETDLLIEPSLNKILMKGDEILIETSLSQTYRFYRKN